MKLMVEKVLRTGKPARAIDQQGEFWFDIYYNPLFDASELVIRIAIFAKNITEEKKIQDALRQEENRAQLYLDIAGAIILAFNPDGKVCLINQKGCELLAYPREEIVAKIGSPTSCHRKIRPMFGKFSML